MTRTTKVVGFSLPPKTNKKLEALLKEENKTRSEFLRGLIDTYNESINETQAEVEPLDTTEADLATLLNAYWQTRSALNELVIVIGLGIIQRPDGKIIIGARREKDEYVTGLSWVFPGGMMESLDFENHLKKTVKDETSLDVEIKNLVASRIHPGSGHKNVQIVALYFYCKTRGKQKAKPGTSLKQLKWVKPHEVFKYFTTSTNDDTTRFLLTLDKSR